MCYNQYHITVMNNDDYTVKSGNVEFESGERIDIRDIEFYQKLE